MSTVYEPLKVHTTHTHHIHNTDTRVHTWGCPDGIPLFLLHGWADTGTSFQFLVDAMSDEWFLIAPDWCGFGESDWKEGGYWFPDYLALLDALMEVYSPQRQVILVGHSMGGNIACIYAGLRPERISHLVNMEGFGLPDSSPGEAPGRYREWLDQKKSPPAFSRCRSFANLARLVRKQAPRLSQERAMFIARQWARKRTDGEIRLKADPAHKMINPVLYRREEAKSCWSNVTARTLLLLGKESYYYNKYFEEGMREEFNDCFRNMEETIIEDAGHMLHHDQPEHTAREMESFLKQ